MEKQIPVIEPSEVRSITNILKPKELSYYEEQARYYKITQQVKDLFGFIDFYIRMSNPDVRLADEEINKQAKMLVPKLDREAENVSGTGKKVFEALEAGKLDPRLTREQWLNYIGRNEKLAKILSDVSSELRTGSRLDKVLAIDKLIGTQHRESPTVLPQIFEIRPETRYQPPVTKVLDFLAMSEGEKKDYLLKRSKSPQFKEQPQITIKQTTKAEVKAGIKKIQGEGELQEMNRQDVIAARAEQVEYLDDDENWLVDDGMPGKLTSMPSPRATPTINRQQMNKKKPSRRANDSPMDSQLSRMSNWP